MSQVQGVVSGSYSPPPSSEVVARGSSSSMERNSAGEWTIRGSCGDDSIHVSQAYRDGTQYLSVAVNQDNYLVPITGLNAARSLAIYAGAGNDSVFVEPNVTFPLFIDGGPGNDYLKGGSGPNALLGGGGNDILIGGCSDDLLLGGEGYNTVQGNGGRDMHSLSDLFVRLQEGRCKLPPPPVCPKPPQPQPAPIQPAPLPPPPPPPFAQSPVQPAPCPPPQPAPIQPAPPPPPQPQKPQQHAVIVRPKPKPQTPPRPNWNDLLRLVDSHGEPGFKSGRDMTKNLLTALYQSPNSLRQALSAIGGAKERDDAVASFTRALLEAGPGGASLFKEIPSDIRRTLLGYLESGNAWSPKKAGLCLALADSISPALYNTLHNSRDNFRTPEAQAAYQQYRRAMGVL